MVDYLVTPILLDDDFDANDEDDAYKIGVRDLS
jgi:hypothetical protein